MNHHQIGSDKKSLTSHLRGFNSICIHSLAVARIQCPPISYHSACHCAEPSSGKAERIDEVSIWPSMKTLNLVRAVCSFSELESRVFQLLYAYRR